MFNFQRSTLSHISIDCIKVCPFQMDLFALAYYQTNPEVKGAIAVSKITQAEDIDHIKYIQCPPLLHIIWAKKINSTSIYILAAASREDDVLIYEYDSQVRELTLKKIIKVGEKMFCLYIDMISNEKDYQLLVSSNEEKVINLRLDQNFDIMEKNVHGKHEYAVWACRYNPLNPKIFTCGDQVTSIYLYEQNKRIGKNSSAHKGGICDLVFKDEHMLYSGGFDGIVCLFDLRKFDMPVYRHQWGGTIWRIIPNQAHDQIILCNSSQKKFQIVDPTLFNELWNSGTQHDSLAYAADYGQNTLLTASFYDKTLCFWGRNK